jgi:hypothetical protein
MLGRRRHGGWLGVLSLGAVLAVGGSAAAQILPADSPSRIGEADEYSGTPRSRATNAITMREGTWTLGGSLSFVTAEEPPVEFIGTDVLRLTDLVLLNVAGRYSLGDVELYGATSLLPKQPRGTDALFWQGARVGLRWGLVEHFALSFATAGGPMLTESGWWSAGGVYVEARTTVHSTITFMGTAGASVSGLFAPGVGSTDAFGFSEALVGGEIILHAGGFAAFWVGVDFHIPVWASSDTPSGTAPFFDPGTRASVRVGAVLSYVEDWDLYAEYAILDRGEAEAPSTRMPLLDGGFDQQQLVIGVVKYFRPRPELR